MNDSISAFDRRLSRTPSEWRGPLVDVIDTFASLKVGLSDIGISDTACLIEAVKLVLDRHDRSILREQALAIFDDITGLDAAHENTIRRALEALPE